MTSDDTTHIRSDLRKNNSSDSAQHSLTQLNSALLSSTQLDSTRLSFFQIRPYVCGVVRCHPTALFLVFWHDHTADGGSLLKYYVHTERHCYIPHWQNGCSTVQHRSALLSERFNSMRCFFTEWWGRPNGTFSSFDKSKPKDYNLSNVSFTILMLMAWRYVLFIL